MLNININTDKRDYLKSLLAHAEGQEPNGITRDNVCNLRTELVKVNSSLESPQNIINARMNGLFSAAIGNREEATPANALKNLEENENGGFLPRIGRDIGEQWGELTKKVTALANALKANDPDELKGVLKDHFGGFDIIKFLENIAPENYTRYTEAFGLPAS